MIKKIAMFAFAMSAAFSNAFAADCEIDFSGATTFTGNQIKPTVTKVVCGTDEYTDIDESQITYGENINAGKDAGSITVALSSTLSAETKFTIKQKSIYIQTENCEKEMGASDPEFKWHMLEVQNLNKDTLANLQTRLESLIELTRAEGESILGSNQELMHYDITFANGVDALLAKELPNYRVCLYDEIGYLTISKMKVRVVVLGSSKTYGTKDPEIEYSLRSNTVLLALAH